MEWHTHGSTGIAAALLLLTWASRPARAEPPRPLATVGQDVTFSTVDEDGDGAFDYLTASVPVDVAVAGPFYLSASLYGPASQSLGSASSTVYLPAGARRVQLGFPGDDIQQGGADGAYLATIWLYETRRWSYLGSTSAWTPSHAAAQFEEPFLLPAASYSPPHFDAGADLVSPPESVGTATAHMCTPEEMVRSVPLGVTVAEPGWIYTACRPASCSAGRRKRWRTAPAGFPTLPR